MRRRSFRLEPILDYELRCSVRYHRSLSLVMVAPVKGNVDLNDLLWPILRDSDELCTFEGRAVVLMGQTGRDGALAAIDRYKTHCHEGIDLRFGVACFPEDACTARELLGIVRRRLEKAVTLERGAAVATG